jgi:hypothetical protein
MRTADLRAVRRERDEVTRDAGRSFRENQNSIAASAGAIFTFGEQ